MKNYIFKDLLLNFILMIISIIAIFYIQNLGSSSCMLKNIWCGQDIDQYIDYSDSLLSGHGFAAKKVTNMYFINPIKEKVYVPEVLRLPGYSLILTLGRYFNNNPRLLIYYNFLFYILILFYTAGILKIFVEKRIIPFAFILIAFNPTLLFYTAIIGNADTFACITLTGFTYHLLKLMQNKKIILNTICTCLLGTLASFSRQNTVLSIFPLLLIFSIISLYEKKKETFKYLTLISLFIIFFLGLWTYRNYTIIGKPVLSVASGMQLFAEYIEFTPYSDNSTKNLYGKLIGSHGGEKYITAERKKGKTIPQAYASFNNYIEENMINYMIQNPKQILIHYNTAIKSIYLETTFNWPKKDFLSNLKVIDGYLQHILLYISLFVPLTFFIKIDKIQKYLILSLWASSMIFIYISAFFHGIVIGNRGILPVLPLIIIIAITFLQKISTIISKSISNKNK